jgi:hypothetical protein
MPAAPTAFAQPPGRARLSIVPQATHPPTLSFRTASSGEESAFDLLLGVTPHHNLVARRLLLKYVSDLAQKLQLGSLVMPNKHDNDVFTLTALPALYNRGILRFDFWAPSCNPSTVYCSNIRNLRSKRMRSGLGVSAAGSALLATALCISASAQSSQPNFQKLYDLDKDLDTKGLVNGKREMVCPHSSARALASFVSSNSVSASKTAKSFYSGDSGSGWAYVRVGTKAIPTLRADGNTLDFQHPNNAGLLLYEKQKGVVEKSFWSHKFDQGAAISSGSFLTKEGVDNLANIRSEISTKDFCVIHTSKDTGQKEWGDLIWTNTIVMQDSDVPNSANLESFRKINEQLLESLPPREMRRLSSENTMFITTARTSGGEEIVTFFPASETNKHGHLVGEMHTTNGTEHNREVIRGYIKNLKKGGRVYVYGVDLKSVDLYEIAASYNIELIRRGPTVVKDFLETDRQIEEIAGRKLAPETTSVLNGIPSSKEELEAMGKPSSAPEVWSGFKKAVADKLEGSFSNQIETRDELVAELTAGTNDVVFLLAHFDGKTIYFGTEKVSMKELESLQSTRPADHGPRVAVLLICNAGTLSTGERSLFRRQLNSVGEILIKNELFEKVVAPNHQIESAESINALAEYLSRGGIRQKGWMTLAEAKEYPAGVHR